MADPQPGYYTGAQTGSGIGGGIGGAVGGIVGLLTAGKGGAGYYKDAIKVWQKLKDPNFDESQLTAPELAIVQQEFPQVYDAIVAPQAQQVADNPQARSQQVEALARTQQRATQGFTQEERLAANQAADRFAQQAGRDRDNAVAAAAARGDVGSMNRARQVGGANVAATLGELGSQQAIAAADRRRQADSDLLSGAGQLRQQDIGLGTTNAGIQNRYNEMVAQARNEAAQYAAQQRSAAQTYNVGTAQRVSEQNAMNQYQTAQENLNRKNSLRAALSNFQLAKAQGQSGALSGYGGYLDAKRAAQIAGSTQIGSGLGQAAGGGLGAAYG